MATRTCRQGHPVSVIADVCDRCGEPLAPMESSAPDPAAGGAVAVGGGGWGHIALGLGLAVLAAVMQLGAQGPGSPLGFVSIAVGVVGSVVLLIGIVAEGIKVARG